MYKMFIFLNSGICIGLPTCAIPDPEEYKLKRFTCETLRRLNPRGGENFAFKVAF